MRLPVAALALAVSAGTAGAQDVMPEAYRAVQVRQLQLQRSMLLAMADSMPEAQYRDRVTPVQRDFAQQLHHAAMPVAMLGARFMGVEPPTLPDTADAFASRAGLKAYINATYDWAEATLKAQTPETRAEVVKFFGMDVPRWQVWDELHTHTVWTAGQVVANFRKHGMAPPGFGFF